MDTITYTYRGMVERPARRHRGVTYGRKLTYAWRRGYSETGVGGRPCFPWRTKTECWEDAELVGREARFIRGDE